VVESSFKPHLQSQELLKAYPGKCIVATGYGRHLARKHFAQEVITEIKAHALGGRYLFPGCRTILDVGGQDSKVISLDALGKVSNFQMNDKCAAGTGKFLEMMAGSLGYELDQFGKAAAQSEGTLSIGNMCAVFAESEVVSLRNDGHSPEDIARAVHMAVVDRVAAMLERIGINGELVFSGGVANNCCIAQLLEKKLGRPVLVPKIPDIVGALGAALHRS
jgi:predicted CoA-substrate-specific enzyme activase